MSDKNPAFSQRFVTRTDATRVVSSKKLVERNFHTYRPGSPEPRLRVILNRSVEMAKSDLASQPGEVA